MKIIRANIIQSQRAKDEIKLSNDVTIYENKDIVSRDVTTHNTEDCGSRVLMIKQSQR